MIRPTAVLLFLPLVEQGDLLVAISTSGQSPALAKVLRQRLQKEIGPEYSSLLKLLGAVRTKVRSFGFSQKRNQRIFRKLVRNDLLSLIRKRDWRGSGHAGPVYFGARLQLERVGLEEMNVSFFQAALFIYLLGTAISLAYLVSLRRPLSRLGTIALGVGFTVHTLALVLRYIEAGYTPITNLHESLSFFSWSIVGVYFLLYWKYRVDVLAAFISPMAAVLIILASLFPKEILPVAPRFA